MIYFPFQVISKSELFVLLDDRTAFVNQYGVVPSGVFSRTAWNAGLIDIRGWES